MNTYQLQVPHGIPDAVCKDMRVSLSHKEKRIVSDLHQVAVNAFVGRETSGRFWTKGIKNALTLLAKEQDLLCCHSDSEETGEWLYDVCWVETAPGAPMPAPWRRAQRLILVCESEWSENENDILWDFMKLSWAQADLRLFIYTNHMKRKATKHPVVLCRENCPPSRGARFLLIGFPKRVEDGEMFRVDAWTT
jgi:hypothetical protein